MFVKNAKETCGELKNRILYSLWRIPFFVFIMLVVKCGEFIYFIFIFLVSLSCGFSFGWW